MEDLIVRAARAWGVASRYAGDAREAGDAISARLRAGNFGDEIADLAAQARAFADRIESAAMWAFAGDSPYFHRRIAVAFGAAAMRWAVEAALAAPGEGRAKAVALANRQIEGAARAVARVEATWGL